MGKRAGQVSNPAPTRRRSIRTKLATLVMLAVCISVTLIASFSAFRDATRDAALERSRLAGTAAVLASTAGEAVAKRDRTAAYAVIRAIARLPGVTYARLDQSDGYLLVETGDGVRLKGDARSGGSAPTQRRGLGDVVNLLRSHSIEVEAPVIVQGAPVGRAVVLGSSEGALGRLLSSLRLSLLAAALASIVGVLAAWRLQSSITRPLIALTRSMQTLEHSHDYGAAIEISADDEVGDLVSSFQGLLGEIGARDRRIAAHVEELEARVADRTRDLARAKDEAEAANGAKSDFLATMSHEIRTPMNGIMVMAEMLAVGDLPQRYRRFAEVIANSGSSLLAIINDILDFSKIEAGKLELEAIPVNLTDVVEDVCSLFWEKAASKGIDLAGFVCPTAPQVVSADPVRLRQVLGNLVNNAIKFTETGGVLVEVELERLGQLRLSVRDTGIGIPKDKIGGVFGAFSQADQSTTRKFGGTGLGLAICKRLVDTMGGRFIVDSAVGRGSVFAFSIPVETLEPAQPWPHGAAFDSMVEIDAFGPATGRALRRYVAAAGLGVAGTGEARPTGLRLLAPQTAAETPSDAPVVCVAPYGDSRPAELMRKGAVKAVLVQPFRRAELSAVLDAVVRGVAITDPQSSPDTAAAGAAIPQFPNARILVADDSAVNREVAYEALSRLGVNATLVADGREAVNAVLAARYDLVLMDGSMPVLDGYDATREIRAAEAERGAPPTPIVALTAHVVGSSADAWKGAGMDGVLHKPFTLNALAATLAGYITPVEGAAPAEPAPLALATPVEPVASSGLIDATTAAELSQMGQAGNGQFLSRIIRLYRDNAPPAVDQIAAAAVAGDHVQLALAAHALKSMSLNVGATQVVAMAAALEARAREGAVAETYVEADLRATLTATMAELGRALGLEQPAAPAAAPDSPETLLMRALSEAIAADGLTLMYQPQFERDGSFARAVEALIRWNHPTLGRQNPAEFIPVAERHGAIRPLTDWVLRTAMRETKPFDGLKVACNASAGEFADTDFVSRVKAALDETGFDPHRLEIEITETAILANAQNVSDNIVSLQALGATVSLDDFGVGYSSLLHLRRYPFNKLKIDREFVIECDTDVQSASIIHAVISIGRAMGMRVLAEGVETMEQYKFLKIAGVHALQGYLFAKPIAAPDLAKLAALDTTPVHQRRLAAG